MKLINPYDAQTYFQYVPILPSSDLTVLNRSLPLPAPALTELTTYQSM